MFRHIYPISSPIILPERADLIGSFPCSAHGGAGLVANDDFQGDCMVIQRGGKGRFNAFRSHVWDLFFRSQHGLRIMDIELSQHSMIKRCMFREFGDAPALRITGDTSSMEDCDFWADQGRKVKLQKGPAAVALDGLRQFSIRDCTVHKAYVRFALNNCYSVTIDAPETEMVPIPIAASYHANSCEVRNGRFLHNDLVLDLVSHKWGRKEFDLRISGTSQQKPCLRLPDKVIEDMPIRSNRKSPTAKAFDFLV